MHVVWLLAVACDQVHGLIGVIFPILFVVLPSYVCESIKKRKINHACNHVRNCMTICDTGTCHLLVFCMTCVWNLRLRLHLLYESFVFVFVFVFG